MAGSAGHDEAPTDVHSVRRLKRVLVDSLGVLSARSDRVDLLTQVCHLAATLVPCEGTAVFAGDPSGDEVATWPTDTGWVGWMIERSGRGPWNLTAEQGRAHVGRVDDLHGTGLARFVSSAHAVGVTSFAVLPLVEHVECIQLGDSPVGALALFRSSSATTWEAEDLEVAQAIACMCGAQLRTRAAIASAARRIDDLERALQSRIVIEQAKGMAAVRLMLDVETAFQVLRARARQESRPLAAVAADVVAGRLDLTT